MPELKSQEDVARWLVGKPRDVAVVFITRAALRVIPVLASTFGLHGREVNKTQRDTVLRTFRCAAAAWAAAAFPGYAPDLLPAAAAAGSRSDDRTASSESAVAWAAAAAGAIDIGNFASHAVTYTIEAAAAGGHQPFDDILSSYVADAAMLDQRISPVTLALSSTLWRNVPDWAFEAWAELDRALLDADEDWEVWTDWYEARLKGGPADQVLEVARATISNDVWEEGPKAVNAEITRMFEEREIWRYGTADEIEPESADVAPEVPPAGSVKDLERRLANLSFEEASAIGARVALRAVPLLKPGPAEFGVAFLSMWRAVSLAWAAVEYPTNPSIRARSVPAYAEASKSRVALVRAIGRATIAPAANSMTDSVTHVLAVGIDALRSAAIRSDGIAAGSVFDSVLSQDLNDFSGAPSTTPVADLPLWPGDSPPEWTARRWDALKRDLIKVGVGWEYWVDWYENRLSGRVRSEGRELAYVEVPVELWAEGPVRVNTWIIQRIKELEAQAIPSPGTPGSSVPVDPVHLQARTTPQSMPSVLAVENILTENILTENEAFSIAPPIIPAQRAAALEPVWSKGRLTLPKKPVKSDLTGRQFAAALKSLREELRAFANDIAGEANIDMRFASYVRQLVEQIPQKSPRQAELFRLGHAETVFAGYAKTVNEEWPPILATRYHALALHFDRTMRQSPLWREFKRNAAQQTLTSEQIRAAAPLAAVAANALRSDDAKDIIDPAVPQTLEQLVEPLLVAITGSREPPEDAIEVGKEELAYDVVESFNNVLKRILEAAIWARVSETAKKATTVFAAEAEKSVVKEAKRMGQNVGPGLRKLVRRLIVATGGYQVVGKPLIVWLVATYPATFKWLEPVANFLLSR